MSAAQHQGRWTPKNPAIPAPSQVVAPGPVDFTFQCEEAQVNGERRVVLSFFTPTGLFRVFVPPPTASAISDRIKLAASGLRPADTN